MAVCLMETHFDQAKLPTLTTENRAMIAETTAKPKPEFDYWHSKEFLPKQIMPADGWFAVYEDNGTLYHDRLAAWACGGLLITHYKRPAGSKQCGTETEKFTEPRVWGLVAEPGARLESAEEPTNFKGYIHKSELPPARPEATEPTEART